MKVRRRELITESGRDYYVFDMRVVRDEIENCYVKVIRELSSFGKFHGVTCRGYHDMDSHGYEAFDTMEKFEERIPYLTGKDYDWETALFSVTVGDVDVSCSLKPGGLGVIMDISGERGETFDGVRDKMIDFAEKNGWIWGPRPDFF